ncbi:MAG: DUF92 domain-containing protein [Candidatus Altiarchaeota archaeon]|nr:DUF92 domain-containing protein [Candidatus Altiarchaeota archaeon]
MEFYLATVIIAILFIIFAYWKGKIDSSALVLSGVVGFVVLFSLGGKWPYLWLILVFFFIGNLVTKYRYSRKESNGVAEGIRTWKNVFGNGGSATIFALLYGITGNEIILLGLLGAMATAAGDTFATEVGEAHEREPRLITTFKKVKVGTSGAISRYGLVAALVGAGIISFIAFIITGNPPVFLVGVLAGFIGCNVDSLVGATIEKMLNKHVTNFLGTLSGGMAAVILSYLIL